jgi:hypothetical protein
MAGEGTRSGADKPVETLPIGHRKPVSERQAAECRAASKHWRTCCLLTVGSLIATL